MDQIDTDDPTDTFATIVVILTGAGVDADELPAPTDIGPAQFIQPLEAILIEAVTAPTAVITAFLISE